MSTPEASVSAMTALPTPEPPTFDVPPWRPPDALHLKLSTDEISADWSENDLCGWQLWHGQIMAGWRERDDDYLLHRSPAMDEDPGDLEDDDEDSESYGPLPAGTVGHDGQAPRWEDETVWLEVGHLERWELTFYDDRKADAWQVRDAGGLLRAADAISESLTEIASAVAAKLDEEQILSEALKDLLGVDPWRYDRLLVLDRIELLPQVRGRGIGAWASARSLAVLAPTDSTLIATKAAPMRADDFREEGDDPRTRLTEQQLTAWHRAQQAISAYWQRTLDLRPLPDSPNILVGTGSFGPHRARTASLTWPAQR